MGEVYGNPSSIHQIGRKAKVKLVECRSKIAELLGCSPMEIIFTSGGTEADNMAVNCAVRDLGAKRIISSKLEHHAILHTVEELETAVGVHVDWVKVDEQGHIELEDLEDLLKKDIPTVVTLMHSNNEIGTMIDLVQIGELCQKYGAWFHTDTVQTVGYFPFNLAELPVDFSSGSAHKFNGPKGVGFMYKRKDLKIRAFIQGGAQENNQRGGTENLYGIVGMTRALEIACEKMDSKKDHISGLKQRMIDGLRSSVPGVTFNGDPEGRSHYTVLSVNIPGEQVKDMMLFSLDLNKVCASGGSACSSGSDVGSHVLTEIGANPDMATVRFSFGYQNTMAEVDRAIQALNNILGIKSSVSDPA